MTSVLAVVIVTFSAPSEVLQRCIEAVRRAGDCDRIIVVDNGGWAEMSEGVELIRPARNLGFGGGANEGFAAAKAAGATRVALLNDDVEVTDGWLRPLLDTLDDDALLGAVQPKLLIAGSDPARVNSVGVCVGRDGAGRDIGFEELDGPGFEKDREIEAFTGGAVLFRGKFLDDTGGFDPSYFLYYEDLDLARRGMRLGWRYRCVPDSVVHHAVSASTGQLGDTARYFQERNRLRFVFRHGDAPTMGRALWLSVRRLRWQPRGTHARALAAGLKAAPAALLARRR